MLGGDATMAVASNSDGGCLGSALKNIKQKREGGLPEDAAGARTFVMAQYDMSKWRMSPQHQRRLE